MVKYEDIIVHSTESELRIAVGSAVDSYTDKEDSSVIWLKMRGSDKFLPHTLAAKYMENEIESGSQSGVQGPQGAQGQIGAQGPQGAEGVQGLQGLEGPQGPEGAQGVQGSNGLDGVQGLQGLEGAQGQIGAQGAQGAEGVQGLIGPQGPQGNNFTIKHSFSSIEEMNSAIGDYAEGDIVIINTDESQEDNGKVYQKSGDEWKYLMDVQSTAVQGMMGPEGAQGPQGAQGAQGVQGANGLDGIQGPQGAQGMMGPDGAQGAQGQIGAQGPQGAEGVQGLQGLEGPQGPEGVQGVQGANGLDGAQGTQGAQGEAGKAEDNSYLLNGLINLETGSSEEQILSAIGSFNEFRQAIIDGKLIIDKSNDEKFDYPYRLLQTEVAIVVFYFNQDTYKRFEIQNVSSSPLALAVTTQSIAEGVEGPQGPQGVQGPQGAEGAQGLQGLEGPQGPQGAQGVQGANGLDGVQGVQGPHGDTNVSIVNIPIRTLSAKVYDKSVILGWFNVNDEIELKKLFINKQLILRYGITLSTNPMYYHMPIHYAQFEDNNAIKLVLLGLDTTDDSPATYQILMNLDGSLIAETQSNVECKVTKLQ